MKKKLISIQALYDYKHTLLTNLESFIISIQVLYDYKKINIELNSLKIYISIKHCTIIRVNA